MFLLYVLKEDQYWIDKGAGSCASVFEIKPLIGQKLYNVSVYIETVIWLFDSIL